MLCCILLFATLWTIAHHAPLSMGFFQTGMLEWIAVPPPGDLPDPGIEPASPSLQADPLSAEPAGKPIKHMKCKNNVSYVAFGWNIYI